MGPYSKQKAGAGMEQRRGKKGQQMDGGPGEREDCTVDRGRRRNHDRNSPGQGWDIRVTPNPLSENAHSLWEAGVGWGGAVERGTKRVNKGEEESVTKHIPGIISLGGEDRNFN